LARRRPLWQEPNPTGKIKGCHLFVVVHSQQNDKIESALIRIFLSIHGKTRGSGSVPLRVLANGRLASGSHDTTIRLWDLITGAERLPGNRRTDFLVKKATH
jgi:WD40 repeat protein